MRNLHGKHTGVIVAAMLSLALVLAACGSDDEGPAAGATGAAAATGVADDEHMDDEAMGETMGEDDPGHEAEETTEIPDDAQTIEVTAAEFEYSMPELTVEADHPVAVTLHNEGLVEHDWTIHDASGTEIAFAHTQPGGEAVAVFTVEAGTYEVWCTVPGHKEAGMTATVTAT